MSILTPIYGFIKSQIGDNIGKTIDEDLPANWDKVETLINDLDALHEVGVFIRDLSLTGTQKITTAKKPKALILQATVNENVGKTSWGLVSRTKNYCLFDFHNSIPNVIAQNSSYSIIILNTGANRTYGAVTLFEDDGFTVTWTHKGTGATGLVGVNYMVIY